jgi:hypothetical protein
MTQLRRVLGLGLSFAALMLPLHAAAQIYVTPTIAPTPVGTLVTVNNGSGDQ